MSWGGVAAFESDGNAENGAQAWGEKLADSENASRGETDSSSYVAEESSLFDEAAIDAKIVEPDHKKEQPSATKSKKENKIKLEEFASKVIGILDVQETELFSLSHKVSQQWLHDLQSACEQVLTSGSSFEAMMNRRIKAQEQLHESYFSAVPPSKKADNTPKSKGITDNSVVPVVVRLGVLTLFPLIESLSGIKEAHYDRLCSRTLGILHSVLATLKPLALSREPSDCLDAFEEFAVALLRSGQFVVDSDTKALALTSLLGLSILRGSAKHILFTIEVLFNVLKASGNATQPVQMKQFLPHIAEAVKNSSLSVPYDRGFQGSWTSALSAVTLQDGNQPEDMSQLFSAIACDDSYVYIHSPAQGLLKLGTGSEETVRGHVYAQNASYRTSDTRRSIAWHADKLFYTSPELSGPKHEHQTKVAILSTSTLQEELVITLPFPGDPEFNLVLSDGRHLYLVMQQETSDEKKSADDNKKDTKKEKDSKEKESQNSLENLFDPTLVHIFDYSNGSGVTKRQTIKLSSCATEESSGAFQEPPLYADYYERGCMYTTGHQLVVLLPPLGSKGRDSYTKARVFNLSNGKWLHDVDIKNEPVGSAACYDARHNRIWCFSQTTSSARSWVNLGVVPPHHFSDSPADAMFLPFSPEHVLSTTPFSQIESAPSLSALQAIIVLLANMDTLARQHPLYGDAAIVTKSRAPTECRPFFVLEPEKQLFELIYSVLGLAHDCAAIVKDQSMIYVALACLRVLKVNIAEFICTKKFKVDPKEVASISQQLRALALRFIDDPSTPPLLKLEACRTLVVGLTLFFPSSQEQAHLLLELLEGGAGLNAGRAQLRTILLDKLQQWAGVSAIFLEGTSSTSDKMAVDASAPPESQKQTYRLIFALVDTAFEEATKTITSLGDGPAPLLRVTATQQLLLALQRDLLENDQHRPQFLKYASELLLKSKALMDLAAAKKPKTHVADALRSTLLGTALRSLVLTLCRKSVVQDVAFVSELLPSLRKLVSVVDQLNHLLPEITIADNSYYARRGKKEPKRTVVETKHPYPHGKNQLKETVSFPGVEALSLRFDQRCSTVNSGSDILQLFKNDQLSEAVVNPKDGNPLFYSGTNWPTTPLHIPGDTITFLFTSNTRSDPLALPATRFGFRCIVAPVVAAAVPVQPLLTHWLLDLENSLAQLSTRCSKALVAGPSFGELELRAMSWLNSPLLRGGLESTAELAASNKWLDELVSGTGTGAALYEWMKSQTRGTRPQASSESIQFVEAGERHLIAAILKHTGLVSDAASFATLLSSKAGTTHEQLFAVADVACGVARHVAFKAQVLSRWQRAAKEDPKLFDWNLDHAALHDLAVYKDLETHGHTDKELEQQLTDKLQHEFSTQKDILPSNAYELVSRPLIERAKFLLRLKAPLPAEPPAAEKANPYALHRPSSLIRSSDDASRSERDLLRSVSAYHETEAALQRNRKKALEEMKQKAFSRRVKELRNWISAYKGWRRLITSSHFEHKKDLPPQNPLAAVAAFVEATSFSSSDIESLIKVHSQRAASRVQGLSLLCELLDLNGFASVRHQVLGTAASLFHNGHFLDHVQSAGPEAVRQVRSAFSDLFQRISANFALPALDPVSKSLALGIFAMQFEETDADLLVKQGTFSALQKLGNASSSTSSSTAMDVDGLSKGSHAEERKRYTELRNAAWIAFRLLGTQCVGWERDPTKQSHTASDALRAIQQQVTEIVCTEIASGDSPETNQLLSLLFLLSTSSGGIRALSKPEMVERLVGLLTRSTTAPCAKRLLLRLCRKLLPDLKFDPKQLVDTFLIEIGKLLVPAKDAVQKAPPVVSSAMDVDKPKDAEAKPAEEGIAPVREQWGVYLNTWTQGQPRLVETCLNVFGPDIFGALASIGGSVARVASDSRARQILAELEKPEGALIKSGTKDECTRWAQGLAASGAVATVRKANAPSSSLGSSLGASVDSADKKRKSRNSPNSVHWVTGRVRNALASEYIALLRFLLHGKALFADSIRLAVRTTLQQLPAAALQLGDLPPPVVQALLATLAVVGGFTEPLRVGGRVEVSSVSDNLKKRATVISLLPAQAEIVFEGSGLRSQRFDVSRLTSVGEFSAKSNLFAPTADLIRSLLGLLQLAKPSSNEWLPADIRARSIRAVSVLLDADTAKLLASDADAMAKLRELGNSAKAAGRLQSLERQVVQLAEQYADAITCPSTQEQAKPMAATLPYSPCNQLAVILPTCFERPRANGLVFTGDDRRIVEAVSVINAPPRGGARWRPPASGFGLPPPAAPSEQELLVLANISLPSAAPSYYFEVTIEKAPSGAIISVGFCPERATQWADGSYRYQANSKRTTYVGGVRRQDNYGVFYRAGSVVGAWYSREEKTISFTRDGEELGVAFRDVVHNFQPVPVVGISPGVRVRINFGQEPFLAKVDKKQVEEPEDPAIREQKRLEAEAKRKKEREEEEARRKKEAQDLENQRKQAAQPIMAMGYTLQQGLKALAATGYSGTDAAVLWLLDNADASMEPEEPEKPAESPAKPEEKAEDKPAPAEDKPALSVSVGAGAEVPKNPEEKYSTSTANTYLLDDCFSWPFERTGDGGPAPAGGSGAPNEWEDVVIPDLKRFMEGDGFSKFEVEDYLQQIRMQLAGGNEAEARDMIAKITNNSGAIRLPSSGGKSSSSQTASKPALKIEEIKIGMQASVAGKTNTAETDWLPAMDGTIGRVGTIKSVELQDQLVQVQFYSSELAELATFWYDVRDLASAPGPSSAPVNAEGPDALQSALIENTSELTKFYARQIALSLVQHGPLQLDGSLPLRDVLSLVTSEHLSSRSSILSAVAAFRPSEAPALDLVRGKLHTLYDSSSPQERRSLTTTLLRECVGMLETASRFSLNGTVNIASKSPPSAGAEKVHIDGAHSIVVLFDRSCSLPSKHEGKLALFKDEQCTEPLISFTGVAQLTPVCVPANRFWVKLMCEGAARQNCRYKFAAVPTHPNITLACWLAQFILELGPALLDNAELEQICNAALDLVYVCRAPSALKEDLFYLLANLLRKASHRQLPLQRFAPLREECLALYDAEKKRGGLFSTYLQSLVEMLVSLKRLATEEPMEVDEPKTSVSNPTGASGKPPRDSKKKSSKSLPKPQKGSKEDEDLYLAMALAASLKEGSAEGAKEPAKSDTAASSGAGSLAESSSDVEDADMSAALAMSRETSSSPAPASPAPPPVKPAGPATSAPAFSAPATFPAGEDDDVAAAIALSLALDPKPSEATPATPPPPAIPATPPPATPVAAASPAPATPSPAPPVAPSPAASPSPVPPAPPASKSSSSGLFSFSFEKPAAKLSGSLSGLNAKPSADAAKSPTPAPANQLSSSNPKDTKPKADPAWLTTLVGTSKLLEYWSASPAEPGLLTRALKAAWQESRKDVIRDRLVLVENISALPRERCPELVTALRRVLADVSRVVDVFVPLTDANVAKGYAIVELLSNERTADALKALNQHKLKELDSKTPPQLKATAFKSLDKQKDTRVREYLHSRLLGAGDLAPKFRAGLQEVFVRYGGNAAGALSPAALEVLQRDTTGESLTPEMLNMILTTYPVAPLPAEGSSAKPAVGLTLEGLVQLYTAQARSSPVETADELVAIGFDLHLDRNAYPTFAAAMSAAKGQFDVATAQQLVQYLEDLSAEYELRSPMSLCTANVGPLSPAAAKQYPLLASMPLPLLRLGFSLVRLWNDQLAQALPLINFSRTAQPNSFASQVAALRGVIFHTTKMQFCYDVLDKTAISGSQPTVTLDRLKLAAKKERDAGSGPLDGEKILTRTAFGAAFEQLKNTQHILLRQRKPLGTDPHVAFKVVFKGEYVEGEGGPYRQFFTDVSKELQSSLPLLVPCPNAVAKIGDNRDKHILAPARDSASDMQMYEFLGRLMGTAMRTGSLLILDLPSFVWKPLVGVVPDREDLRKIDTSLFDALRYLETCSREEFAASVFEKFTTVLSDRSVTALKSGGEEIDVTYDNRLDYRRLVEEARLNESVRQLAAVRRGLIDVVPEPLLQLLTWQDLEWRVCGKPFIDIALLRRHTEYSNVSPDAPHIGYFWQVLEDLSQDERRKFVRFAWAQERLPADDHEFQRTQTRMLIKPFMGAADPNSTFPKADTCFFNLALPEYSSLTTLREKLLFAINNTDTMDADVPRNNDDSLLGGRSGVAAQLSRFLRNADNADERDNENNDDDGSGSESE